MGEHQSVRIRLPPPVRWLSLICCLLSHYYPVPFFFFFVFLLWTIWFLWLKLWVNKICTYSHKNKLSSLYYYYYIDKILLTGANGMPTFITISGSSFLDLLINLEFIINFSFLTMDEFLSINCVWEIFFLKLLVNFHFIQKLTLLLFPKSLFESIIHYSY